jgi:hypothetical protein
MPYFAADFAQPLVPQLGFPITRRSDSLKKPYKKAAPGDSGRGHRLNLRRIDATASTRSPLPDGER